MHKTGKLSTSSRHPQQSVALGKIWWSPMFSDLRVNHCSFEHVPSLPEALQNSSSCSPYCQLGWCFPGTPCLPTKVTGLPLLPSLPPFMLSNWNFSSSTKKFSLGTDFMYFSYQLPNEPVLLVCWFKYFKMKDKNAREWRKWGFAQWGETWSWSLHRPPLDCLVFPGMEPPHEQVQCLYRYMQITGWMTVQTVNRNIAFSLNPPQFLVKSSTKSVTDCWMDFRLSLF